MAAAYNYGLAAIWNTVRSLNVSGLTKKCVGSVRETTGVSTLGSFEAPNYSYGLAAFRCTVRNPTVSG